MNAKRRIAGIALTFTALILGARAEAAPLKLEISAQPMTSALREFARQSGLQIVYRDNLILESKVSSGLSGEMEPEVALQTLLSGSDLRYDLVNRHTVSIQSIEPDIQRSVDDVQPYVVLESPQRAPTPAVEELLFKSMPMPMASEHQSPSLEIDLRGLVTGNVLILINGIRPSAEPKPGSIPERALEKIEVYSDSMAKAYGSDASGGVVNLVLKPGFTWRDATAVQIYSVRGTPRIYTEFGTQLAASTYDLELPKAGDVGLLHPVPSTLWQALGSGTAASKSIVYERVAAILGRTDAAVTSANIEISRPGGQGAGSHAHPQHDVAGEGGVLASINRFLEGLVYAPAFVLIYLLVHIDSTLTKLAKLARWGVATWRTRFGARATKNVNGNPGEGFEDPQVVGGSYEELWASQIWMMRWAARRSGRGVVVCPWLDAILPKGKRKMF